MARVPGRKSLSSPPADEQEVSTRAARSELARHGPRRRSVSSERRNGFPRFTVSRGNTPLALERVKQHEDRRLCDAVLSLLQPRLAREEPSPGIERCLGYAEADAIHAKAHDEAKARFTAARTAIFIEHYPEHAAAPNAHRHLFGKRALALNTDLDKRAVRPFNTAKRTADDAREETYTLVFEASEPKATGLSTTSLAAVRCYEPPEASTVP